MTAPEYELVELPDGVPECLLETAPSAAAAHSSFIFGKGGSGSSGHGGTKKGSAAKPKGFDPAKAVKALGASEDGDGADSACLSRGDGLFEGGAAFRREGNKVIMAPNAFSEENAMKTLEQLDRQQLLAQRKEPPPPEKQEKLNDTLNMSSLDPSEVKGIFDLLHAASGGGQAGSIPASREPISSMFDISDDTEKRAPGSGFDLNLQPTETPSFSVTERAPTDKHNFRHIQVDIDLPKISSVSEADVRVGPTQLLLTAGRKYRLKMQLPCSVVDGESNAKWNKSKKRLTLYLRATKAQG
mmetsp:Transcript_22778/g.63252  ORF Transcript_22778/g.63252 Transcript_22778/m.63252 type:complete len:299 (+) Transcript_22778:223-1119(+)